MAQLTARAAAERLGVSYSTLKQWIHQGVVRTTQTSGGHHRVAESEVERLLAHRHPNRPAPKGTSTPQAWIVALSGRNRLHGFVEEVRADGLLAQVRLRIGDQRLTAVITRDAVEELKLKRGEDAVAIIKATEVMIAREVPATESRSIARHGGAEKGGRTTAKETQRTATEAQRTRRNS